MKSFRSKIATPVIAAVIVVSGCADLKRNEWEPTSGSLLIGLLGQMTGSGGRTGRSTTDAARLAAQEINEAGGVLGMKVEVIVKDTKQDADFCIASAAYLVEHGVVGMIGAVASSMTKAAALNVTIPNNMPLISPASTNPTLSTLNDNGTFFRTVVSDAFQGTVLASRISGLGVKTIAAVYIDNDYGKGLFGEFKRHYEEVVGNKVLVALTYDAKKINGFSDVAGQLVAAGAQGIVMIGYQVDTAALTVDLKLAGSKAGTQYFGVDGNYDSVVLSNGDLSILEGMSGTAPATDPSDVSYRKFFDKFVAEVGDEPSSVTENVYDAMYLMALAMARGKAATSQAILANLTAVSRNDQAAPAADFVVGVGEIAAGFKELAAGRDVNYEGASGNVDFDANGDVVGNIIWWKVVKGADGKLKFETQK